MRPYLETSTGLDKKLLDMSATNVLPFTCVYEESLYCQNVQNRESAYASSDCIIHVSRHKWYNVYNTCFQYVSPATGTIDKQWLRLLKQTAYVYSRQLILLMEERSLNTVKSHKRWASHMRWVWEMAGWPMLMPLLLPHSVILNQLYFLGEESCTVLTSGTDLNSTPWMVSLSQ